MDRVSVAYVLVVVHPEAASGPVASGGSVGEAVSAGRCAARKASSSSLRCCMAIRFSSAATSVSVTKANEGSGVAIGSIPGR